MAGTAFDATIEVVRGGLSEERTDQLLRFWSVEGPLEGAAARQRLSEVVCALLDDTGAIVGSNSVYPHDVPLIGGRRFWVYRRLLPAAASSAASEMLDAAFTALEAEFEPSGPGPVGVCLTVDDPAEIARHPEAV